MYKQSTSNFLGDYPYLLGPIINAVSTSIAAQEKKGIETTFNVGIAPQKSFPYYENIMIQASNSNFGIYLIIALLFPCINFLQRALEEKSSKTRESMRMMGMLDMSYHVSWFIFYALNVLFVSIEITILSAFIFTHSNILLLFLFYFLYGLSLFGYMMIFIAMFKDVKTGTPIFTIIHLILYYI